MPEQREIEPANKSMKGAARISPPETEKRSEGTRNRLPAIREIMIESLCRGTLLFTPLAYLKTIKALLPPVSLKWVIFDFSRLYFRRHRELSDHSG